LIYSESTSGGAHAGEIDTSKRMMRTLGPGEVRRRLLFEGWRFIHHSYALVAQAHCLCLLRRDDIDLRFLDYPYYYPEWKSTGGIVPPEQERRLVALRSPEPGFRPDATFSMRAEESDFAPPPSGRKFVFGTPEYRVLQQRQRGGLSSGAELAPTIDIVTPSRWCALAYERFGIDAPRIHVVPHGIDPAVLRADPPRRAAARAALRLDPSDHVFLSVGAMTPNKGIDLLLAAFARIADEQPDVRLVLKGADGLYPSREFVKTALSELPVAARETVVQRMIYIGGTYSSEKMADLYRAADVYAAPYRAEGFNLPVLEAAACAVPVICTAGGPTDEFTEPAFCGRIRSGLEGTNPSEGYVGDALAPDADHLAELMAGAMRDRDTWRSMGERGAEHVHRHFTWGAVTDVLVANLFG
jgi:glycosyltransferase involved in cell wall biosynthesis